MTAKKKNPVPPKTVGDNPIIAQLKDELAKKQKEIDKQKREDNGLNSKISELKTEKGFLRIEVDDLSQTVAKLQNELATAETRCGEYETKIVNLRRTLAESREHAKAEVSLRTGIIMGVQAVGGMLTPLDKITEKPIETREGKL